MKILIQSTVYVKTHMHTHRHRHSHRHWNACDLAFIVKSSSSSNDVICVKHFDRFIDIILSNREREINQMGTCVFIWIYARIHIHARARVCVSYVALRIITAKRFLLRLQLGVCFLVKKKINKINNKLKTATTILPLVLLFWKEEHNACILKNTTNQHSPFLKTTTTMRNLFSNPKTNTKKTKHNREKNNQNTRCWPKKGIWFYFYVWYR